MVNVVMILRNTRKLAESFLKGLTIYTLILWAYIVADMFVFPQYQYSPISRLIPIPQNLIGVIAFPTSFFAFVAWQYLRNTASASDSETPQLRNDGRRSTGEITR